MSDQPGLEEKIVSEVLKQTLTTQIEQAEAIDVQVETDLLKVVQGKVDSITVEGQGLVIQEDVRLQELEVQIEEVSINPLSALLGEIELDQPINTTIRVLLTESDLNQAINSDYVRRKLPKLEISLGKEKAILELLPPTEIKLPESGKIAVYSNLKITEAEKPSEISFSAVIYPRTATQPIRLESFSCAPQQGQSLDFLTALINLLQNWSNQPYFKLEKTALRIESLEIQPGTIALQLAIHAEEIPSL